MKLDMLANSQAREPRELTRTVIRTQTRTRTRTRTRTFDRRRQENRELAQGAFRSGDWKLLVNVWCSGYYSHDANVIEVRVAGRVVLFNKCQGLIAFLQCTREAQNVTVGPKIGLTY